MLYTPYICATAMCKVFVKEHFILLQAIWLTARGIYLKRIYFISLITVMTLRRSRIYLCDKMLCLIIWHSLSKHFDKIFCNHVSFCVSLEPFFLCKMMGVNSPLYYDIVAMKKRLFIVNKIYAAECQLVATIIDNVR